MLQIVMRPSIGIDAMVEPAYSTAQPTPAVTPNVRAILRMMSLGVTLRGSAPSMRIRSGCGFFCVQCLRGQHVLDLRRADAPRQRAERAERGRVAVAAHQRTAGKRDPELGGDDVHDALARIADVEERDAVVGAVAAQEPDEFNALRKRGVGPPGCASTGCDPASRTSVPVMQPFGPYPGGCWNAAALLTSCSTWRSICSRLTPPPSSSMTWSFHTRSKSVAGGACVRGATCRRGSRAGRRGRSEHAMLATMKVAPQINDEESARIERSCNATIFFERARGSAASGRTRYTPGFSSILTASRRIHPSNAATRSDFGRSVGYAK